jgi:asparagine synthase (glutamine-hydrolysing)
MCGLAGILNLAAGAPGHAPDPAELRAMAGCIVHRGPDDEGAYLDPAGRCGFGFRRLSIIDLAGGHQPLCNEERTVWLIFNGEIYNYRELRDELVRRGHRLATATDGEVVIHLYEEVGERCFERLAGMFAIALWDERVGRLLLGRDRLGKKPLVYGVHGQRLYFASEAKAILSLPGVPREIDLPSLHRYLVLQYVPDPHSIFRGLRRLPPGHLLAVEAGRPNVEAPRAWWRLPPGGTFSGTYRDAKQQLGELLRRAVRRRLIADVPLGAFLSGGIDSSLVVALMREEQVHPLRTFSIGFPDPRYDERAYARRVAQLFHTEHHELVVTPRARDLLDTLAFHYDEPLGDASAIPTYCVARFTRESVTVALTGDGGDECFAGYDRYRAMLLTAALDALPAPLRSVLARVASSTIPHSRPKSLGRAAYRLLSAVADEPALRYLAWMKIFAPEWLRGAYTLDVARAIDPDEPVRWFADLFDGSSGTPAERANRFDFVSYLPYDLLTKVDIASMACSLECRSPFLDHELIEFAVSLPLSWKLGPRGGKRILRDWARARLPTAILQRRKMGFGVPLGMWFRTELRELVHDTLLARDALCGRIFRPERLRGLVFEHLEGKSNHEHTLWTLLALENWYRAWRPALATP